MTNSPENARLISSMLSLMQLEQTQKILTTFLNPLPANHDNRVVLNPFLFIVD